jgi:hypothetical protein
MDQKMHIAYVLVALGVDCTTEMLPATHAARKLLGPINYENLIVVEVHSYGSLVLASTSTDTQSVTTQGRKHAVRNS